MGLIDVRRSTMFFIGEGEEEQIAYEAYNLSFDRTTSTAIDTGVYLFTQENINRDFELVAEGICGDYFSDSDTIICAKHNGLSYGFLVRTSGRTETKYKGTISVKSSPNIARVIIRRKNGVISLSGINITNPGVEFINNVFDWPLVLGCAMADDGKLYRAAQGTIEHVKVKWL